MLCVKLLHCGNNSLANPEDRCEKNIFFMPMGLFALASALVQNGIDAEIINSDSEQGSGIDEILGLDGLDAVGLDCHWVNQSLAVLETAALIKRIRPEVFVFLGGFTASLFAEEILADHPEIDAVIRGDAEVPIVALCRALEQRLPLRGVPNLCWRDQGGEIRVNDLSYLATAEQLEKLDFAAIELLRSWEYYRKRSIYWTHFAPLHFAPLNLSPLFFLEVGRGCANGCLFCGGSGEAQRVINGRRGVIWRSVDSVLATIEKAASFGFRTFFSDFEFPGSDEWYRELFKRTQGTAPGSRFVYSSWSLASKALVDSLSESFERAFIQLSPETADVELRRTNKGPRGLYTNDELRACLDHIRTKGNLKVQLYFGYFLPFETAATVWRTLEFIMELLLEYPELIEVAYLPFSTDPGSAIFRDPERYDVTMEVRDFRGYVEQIRDCYLVRKLAGPDLRLFRPNGISAAEAADLERRIELFNHLFVAHRSSISQILRKPEGPQIILQLLREPGAAGADEIRRQPSQQVFKAKPQIWLLDRVERTHA